MMRKIRGFTLIELLVVIAIIALLMAILMPALAKARRMTRAVMCVSQEKQWGAFFLMYTDDFDGSFMPSRIIGGFEDDWFGALEPYYKDRELLLCPMANNIRKLAHQGYGNYGVWGGTWYPDSKGGYYYGSYAMNAWVSNPTFKTGVTYGSDGRDSGNPARYWRNTNVKGQSIIPLLGDGWWDQAWAEADDWIPNYIGEWEGTADDMAHYCINRHDGYINMLFMDYTVKKLRIPELWQFPWHRGYEFEDAPTLHDFPPWVQQLY